MTSSLDNPLGLVDREENGFPDDEWTEQALSEPPGRVRRN
jgi:hypothetical protein